MKSATRPRASELGSQWHGKTMIWFGSDNKQNCAPCTLQRGQVEYEQGDEKGEEGESQANHWNLNTVGQAGQWKWNLGRHPLHFFLHQWSTFEVLLNYKLVTESETLGDILFISSSTSGEVLLNYYEKILRPPIKTNWMKTLWAFSAIDKLQY